MAIGENDLTRDVLNRAMDMYGRDQVLGQNMRDLSIGDVRDIADQLGVPQQYVTEALTQPMVRFPSKKHPTTFVTERYVTHSAEEAKAGALEYFRRIEKVAPAYPVPFGFRLTAQESHDYWPQEDDAGLSAMRNVEFTVHQVDANTSVLRLQAEVMAERSLTLLMAAPWAVVGLGTGVTLSAVVGAGLGIGAILCAMGASLGGIAGALIGRYSWGRWVTHLTDQLAGSINAAADSLDNLLPPPPTPGQDFVEGAGRIIGAFMRGFKDKPDA